MHTTQGAIELKQTTTSTLAVACGNAGAYSSSGVNAAS